MLKLGKTNRVLFQVLLVRLFVRREADRFVFVRRVALRVRVRLVLRFVRLVWRAALRVLNLRAVERLLVRVALRLEMRLVRLAVRFLVFLRPVRLENLRPVRLEADRVVLVFPLVLRLVLRPVLRVGLRRVLEAVCLRVLLVLRQFLALRRLVVVDFLPVVVPIRSSSLVPAGDLGCGRLVCE